MMREYFEEGDLISVGMLHVVSPRLLHAAVI